MCQSKKYTKSIDLFRIQFIEIFSAPGLVRTATNAFTNGSHDGSILKIFQSDDFFGPIR